MMKRPLDVCSCLLSLVIQCLVRPPGIYLLMVQQKLGTPVLFTQIRPGMDDWENIKKLVYADKAAGVFPCLMCYLRM